MSHGPAVNAPVSAADPSAPPAWLPAYTPEQQKLLAAPAVAVKMTALRTYPDLYRFGYSGSQKLVDVLDTTRFTRMVARVLEESPRLYVIEEADPALANLIAQYGPAASVEPDGFEVVTRDESGMGELVDAPMDPSAHPPFDAGIQKLSAGSAAEAIPYLRAALQTSVGVPAMHAALGDALGATGDDAAAEASYIEALRVDPTYAMALRGLAEIYWKRGDAPRAKRAIAEALAYYPTSALARATASRITSGASDDRSRRVAPYRPFIEVDNAGVIHVGGTGGSPGKMYASCRAVMRYEPEVRSSLLEESPDTPYYLSMLEEIVCLHAALGAYAIDRMNDEDGADDSPDDPALEALLELAKQEGLGGYVMYEILGQHRPERARTAPPDVHAAVVEYVERHVLGEPATAADGPMGYDAARATTRAARIAALR